MPLHSSSWKSTCLLLRRYFSACAETNVAGRLWEALARAHPDQVAVICVRPGYWVRCQAGWGRINRIETADGHEVTLVRRDQIEEGYRLYVTLRPGEDAEPVVLDTGLRQVRFLQAPHVYFCTTCSNCAARSDGMLYNRHKRAAHEGSSFGFRKESPTHKAGDTSGICSWPPSRCLGLTEDDQNSGVFNVAPYSSPRSHATRA